MKFPVVEVTFQGLDGLGSIAGRAWGTMAKNMLDETEFQDRNDEIRVLLLHGWLDNAATFNRLIPAILKRLNFPNTAVTLIALDLPGHGFSAHRNGQSDYSDWRFVLDVEWVVTQLGWNKFIMASHSMGGAVTTLFGGAFPDRILGTILIDNMGPFASPAPQFPMDLAKWVDGTIGLHLSKSDAVVTVDKEKKRGKPVYNSIEAAIEARSTGSRIPLTPAGAKILCTRGLMEVAQPVHRLVKGEQDPLKPVKEGRQVAKPTGKLYTWRTDQRLTLAEMALHEDACLAFLNRLGKGEDGQAKKPVVFVLATKGYFVTQMFEKKDGKFIGIPDSRFWIRVAACGGRVVLYDGSHHLHLETRVEETAEVVARVVKQVYAKGYPIGLDVELPGEMHMPRGVEMPDISGFHRVSNAKL